MRQAIGDAAGLTIKGQLRRAAENLGYKSDPWRIREAFYFRAGGWSAAALDDLRRRFAAWRERAETGAGAAGPSTLAQRVGEVRRLLTELDRQVAGIESDLGRLLVRDSERASNA